MSVKRARELRRNATEAEKKLWRGLRSRFGKAVKFRRQHPVGGYIVDFVVLESWLIVEVDGGQHAGDGPERTDDLMALGYRLIRFWNNDVIDNIEGVLAEVAVALEQR